MEAKTIHYLAKYFPNGYGNKTVLVTGANSGIGLEVVKGLAYLKSNIIMAIRNLEKGEKAKQEILKEFPDANITILKLDVSSMDSINEFVALIIHNKIDIDVFFTNAGIFRQDKKMIDGKYELTFLTNYYSNYLLMNALIPYFESLNHEVKIILSSSVAARFAHVDLKDIQSFNHFKLFRAYANSKFYICCLAYHFNQQYANTNIKVYVSHPGGTYTPLITKAYSSPFMRFIAKVFMPIFFHSPSKASLSTLRLLTGEFASGTILGPRGLMNLSGYPKKQYLAKRKTMKMYQEIMDLSKELIQ